MFWPFSQANIINLWVNINILLRILQGVLYKFFKNGDSELWMSCQKSSNYIYHRLEFVVEIAVAPAFKAPMISSF